MNTACNNRLIATKAVLWFLFGVACLVTVVRYVRGLGVTTALTDTTPWGMWIGFDVLAGVALAAGGFVIAATVHVLGRERYRAIVRPAILTAFLGYLAVIIGLLVDLGRPWNIWRMIVNRNLHSPLFEVGMCVMLYTTVLALEFAPVGLARWSRVSGVVRQLRRITLPLVIVGIALSTLHQSSLGTLFLLSGPRMHPLWFTPLLPLLFLVSAVGLGLAMITLEGLITSWLYRREPEWPQLGGLTRAAAWVLGLYLLVRLGDIVLRGDIALAFTSSWFTALFWVELSMSAIVPLLLFSLPRTAGQPWAISTGAWLSVSGFILHRADVGGISHIAVTGEPYVPALSEVAVSVGIVSGLGLIFLFFIEKLPVWEEPPEGADHFTPPAVDPVSRQFVRSPWLGGGQRAALAWIFGVIVGIGIMEVQVAVRDELQNRPVQPPRSVLVARTARSAGPGHDFELVASSGAQIAPGAIPERALLIDSGGAGGFVLFSHQEHERRLGGEASCVTCHHLNVPLDRGTSCAHCHRDMYKTSNIFDHELHVRARGDKTSCGECHPDPAVAKTFASAKPCDDCHHPAPGHLTRVRPSDDPAPGLATGYKQAMHGLCIECHLAEELAADAAEPYLSQCAACHREDAVDVEEIWNRDLVAAETTIASR